MELEHGFATVIGMSIAYVASFAGLGLGLVGLAPPATRSGAKVIEPIPADPPIGGPLWSIVVPALLLGVAAAATWLLYRRFSRE